MAIVSTGTTHTSSTRSRATPRDRHSMEAYGHRAARGFVQASYGLKENAAGAVRAGGCAFCNSFGEPETSDLNAGNSSPCGSRTHSSRTTARSTSHDGGNA